MIERLVLAWGYAAVFAGTFLEGESVLVAAGFAAHRGMLDLAIVVVVAACGSFLGDQFFYSLGRRHGGRIMRRFPGRRKFPSTLTARKAPSRCQTDLGFLTR